MGMFNTTVKKRYDCSIYAKDEGCKYRGDVVEVIDFVENEGKTWIKFEEDGEIFYCCAINGSDHYISFNSNSSSSSAVNMNQNSSQHSPVKKEGCCFLCACYLGGLNNIDEADECYIWASKNGWVDSYDNPFVNGKYELADAIAKKYGRQKRSGKIVKKEGGYHFFVVDNGKEVFNSIRIGYRK